MGQVEASALKGADKTPSIQALPISISQTKLDQ